MCLTAYTYLRRGRSAISSVYIPHLAFFRHLSHEQICYNEDAYSRCRVCFGLLAYKHNEEQIRVVCMSVVTNISNSNLVSALCIRVFHFVTICLV